jgi:WS/DGAT/MGAT family acyltransferase
MTQLTALDRMFLTQETPRAPMHISMLAFYDQHTAPGGKVRLRDILAQFEARAPHVPLFNRRVQETPLGLDNPWWVGEAPVIESHVHHLALPAPGDWRQLCIQVARLHARALDRSRPLWEACVIEGLDAIDFLPRGSFAVLLKMHHAAVDGHAALHAIETLHDPGPRGARELGEPPEPERAPSPGAMLRRAGLRAASTPLRWGRLVTDVVPAAGRLRPLLQEQGMPGARERVNTCFNARISGYRVVEAAFFTVDEFQAARAAVADATLNDVVVSVIGGAMRKYLLTRGQLTPVSPVTIAPLSFREAGEREFGGNLVSAMAFPIHTDIEDPLERLAAVTRDSRAAKAVAKALGPRTSLDMMEAIPPAMASLGFLELGTRLLTSTGMATPVNTVITNVAGPKKPLYLAGARMLGIAGFGPIMDSMGLFHAVMSVDGRLSIAINSCRELLPDPAFYMECVRSSWRELQKAVSRNKPARGAERAPPRKYRRASGAGSVRKRSARG